MAKIDPLTMLQFLEMLSKHGSYTKAAKSLYISQPYLTQVIQKKERELGVEIIDRQTTPLQLTEAGRLYYHYLNRLLNEQNQFNKALKVFTLPEKTIIKVGILSSLGTYLLPLFLPTYLAQYPDIQIELVEDIPCRNEERLLQHQIDFLIGQNPETLSPQLTTYECGPHGYYALIPESSTLYQEGIDFVDPTSLSLQKILNEKLLLTTQGSAIRQQMDYLIQKFAIHPNIVLESNNIFTLVNLAQHNLGVTLFPESIPLPETPGNYNLCKLSLEDVSLKYFIAHLSDRNLNQIEKALIHHFLTHLQADLKKNETKSGY